MVDVLAATFVSALLIAGAGSAEALVAGVGAAIIAALGMQALRVAAKSLGPGRDPFYSQWLAERESREKGHGSWTDALPDCSDEPWTPIGVVVTIVGLPFIAIYVVVRILLLNLVSVLIVLAVWAFHSSVSPMLVGLATVLTIGITLVCEWMAILPLAKRWGVRL